MSNMPCSWQKIRALCWDTMTPSPLLPLPLVPMPQSNSNCLSTQREIVISSATTINHYYVKSRILHPIQMIILYFIIHKSSLPTRQIERITIIKCTHFNAGSLAAWEMSEREELQDFSLAVMRSYSGWRAFNTSLGWLHTFLRYWRACRKWWLSSVSVLKLTDCSTRDLNHAFVY